MKLGAGGLVRAYTDAVAQALLVAEKVALRKSVVLRCTVPYALEGWMRRELQAASARLEAVTHGDAVEFEFAVFDADAPALVRLLNEAGQGLLAWRD